MYWLRKKTLTRKILVTIKYPSENFVIILWCIINKHSEKKMIILFNLISCSSLEWLLEICRVPSFLCTVIKTPLLINLLHTELQAFSFGLKLMLDFGFHSVIVESDSCLVLSESNVTETSLWGGVGDIVDLASSCTNYSNHLLI